MLIIPSTIKSDYGLAEGVGLALELAEGVGDPDVVASGVAVAEADGVTVTSTGVGEDVGESKPLSKPLAYK